jgi:nitroreductase
VVHLAAGISKTKAKEMDTDTAIKARRSIRRFKNKKVDREIMKDIVSLSRWAPSWANYQISRYTLVDDDATIERIAANGLQGFAYNIKTLKSATGVAVLSVVKGKSGKLKSEKKELVTSKTRIWEMFDAGIACQTFCLAAYAKGVGTCIFGVIDNAAISKIVGLPEEETVAALIVYGYPDEEPNPTSRKPTEELMRFA